MQLTHDTTNFNSKKFPVILLLDNITSEANIGSIFRLADAFGVEKLLFHGTPPNLDSNRLKRTARNTHKTVDFEVYEDATPMITDLVEDGYKMIAVEITSSSQPISDFKADSEKILLVGGNERHGISEDILKNCDLAYHIEMFGKNSSMNVAQSLGIALYEITKVLCS
ncbi:TrmH family RNA methyltransferase [Christiangramia portivictoriae]|uniref:TrmH family RNA methyltransferase n=1 Tax=Christiangramia portivictoriae TaxID=326069 RepID=UPI00040FBEDD|nr:TrmH family RNA methyltransferase [Christiangramia portivictoriae]